MTQQDWRKDPRLKNMDEQKLKYLTELAEKAGKTPRDKLLPLLMGLASGNNGMNFTDQETDLMVSILCAGMSPAQRKQIETLRMLSQRLGRQSPEQASKK